MTEGDASKRIDKVEERLDKVEERQNRLENEMVETKVYIKQINEKIGEVKVDIKEINQNINRQQDEDDVKNTSQWIEFAKWIIGGTIGVIIAYIFKGGA